MAGKRLTGLRSGSVNYKAGLNELRISLNDTMQVATTVSLVVLKVEITEKLDNPNITSE